MRLQKCINKIVTVGVIVGVITNVSGCKPSQPIENKKVLSFSWWGDEEVHRSTLAAIEKYERMHPEIDIVPEYQGQEGYFQKIATQMASGNLPDIFQYQCSWYEQMASGALEKPADLKKLGVDFEGIEEWIMVSCTVGEEVVIYPICVDKNLLIVNQDFIDEYNFTNNQFKTWDDLLEAGIEVQSTNKTHYLLQISIDEMNEIFLPEYLKQLTGKNMLSDKGKFGFDSTQLTEALDLLQNMYQNKVIPRLNVEAMITGNIDNRRWENGKIGMRFGTISSFINMKEKVNFPISVMDVPQMEQSVSSGGEYQVKTGFAISDHTSYPKEASDFLQWLVCSKEAYETVQFTRGIPANKIIREWLMENSSLEGIYLNIQEDEFDIDSTNSLSCHEEFSALRKGIIIQMLDGKISTKEAAWQIMMETIKIW